MNWPSNTIVIGGSGMTGRHISGLPNYDLKEGYDIRDRQTVREIFEKEKPELVLHLAAFTDVFGAESNESECFSTNTIGTYNIAKACKDHNAALFFVSSVDVFDGEKGEYTPEDKPNPIVVYGDSKYAAETLVRGMLQKYMIFRAGWMFGGYERDHKFISYMVEQMSEGTKTVRAVKDRVGSPTYAEDFIRVMETHAHSPRYGETLHVCNSGDATRYGQALVVADALSYQGDVVPVSMDEFKNFRSLNNATMVSSVPMRPWQDALYEYIENWKKS